jgi:hypothetical protein
MPVTFAPAARTGAHDAHPATSGDVAPVTAAKLLSAASCSANVGAKARIARCCIGGRPGPDNTDFKIAPAPGNGFVDTVLCAYTNHHALVIRPDDVWLAVVSQFSFYATAEGNSCSFFDNASGKIDSFALEISVESDTAQPNLTRLSRRMMRLLPKIIPDADLRDWLIPNFSTTTLTDTTVSCLLVLSGSCSSSSPTATQTRSGGEVDYTLAASYGIPRVTLEGERADWEMLLARLDRLKLRCKDFGLPAVAWYHLLHPVLAGFVGAFDGPERVENREFWGGVVVGKEESNGSTGGSKNAGKLSGWITAFCAFSVEGTWLGPELNAVGALLFTPPPKPSSRKLTLIPLIHSCRVPLQTNPGRSLPPNFGRRTPTLPRRQRNPSQNQSPRVGKRRGRRHCNLISMSTPRRRLRQPSLSRSRMSHPRMPPPTSSSPSKLRPNCLATPVPA